MSKAREEVLSYMRGWKHGACANAQDPKFLALEPKHHAREAYLYGYGDGYRARAAASANACGWYDYKPNVLRDEAKP